MENKIELSEEIHDYIIEYLKDNIGQYLDGEFKIMSNTINQLILENNKLFGEKIIEEKNNMNSIIEKKLDRLAEDIILKLLTNNLESVLNEKIEKKLDKIIEIIKK